MQGSTSAIEGSNFRETRPTAVKDKSWKCLTEEKEILSREHNLLNNHEIVVTVHFWTEISRQKKVYKQSFVKKLRLQKQH